MAVNPGYKKYKRRVKNSQGNYDTISHWTSSNTVEMDDGSTLEEKVATLSEAEELTQAEYNALPATKDTDGVVRYITDSSTIGSADAITYDNTDSGLTATDVQSAIDENASDISTLNSRINVKRAHFAESTAAAQGARFVPNTIVPRNADVIGISGSGVSAYAYFEHYKDSGGNVYIIQYGAGDDTRDTTNGIDVNIYYVEP